MTESRRWAVFKKFHLPQTLFRLFNGLIGTSKVLSFARDYLISAIHFPDHSGFSFVADCIVSQEIKCIIERDAQEQTAE